jgi:hypothetical protein
VPHHASNLFRPSTVAVSLDKPIAEPTVIDTSRFTIGGSVSTTGSVNVTDGNITNPSTKHKTPISAYYGALKFNFDNEFKRSDTLLCRNKYHPLKP